MKLTESQLVTLRAIADKPRHIAGPWQPLERLVRLGLAEWTGARQSLFLKITPAGLARLAESDKRKERHRV